MTFKPFVVHALVLSVLVGCKQGEIVSGVTDSTFVETIVALRLINIDPALDSARRAAARDSLLQSRDLTAETLEAAARGLADDPDRAFALWQRIAKETADDRER